MSAGDNIETKESAIRRFTLRPVKKAWNYVKSSEFTNLALASATVAIAVFTWLTYQVVRSGSQDTQRLITAAETQADAADQISDAADDFTDSAKWMEVHTEDAARAMQDSVNTSSANTKTTIQNAQTAFRDDQRAWIGVQDVVAREFTQTNGLVADVIFFNSGRTPARNVQVSARFVVSPNPITGPPAEEIKNLVFRPAQSIAPQARFNQSLGRVYTGEISIAGELQGQAALISKFQEIKARTATVYYFGIVKYDDIFGHKRETQYCVFLADPDTKQMAYCDAFNDLN